MTIFQAYCTSVENDNGDRYVLTFTDSSVADEWYRAISDTPSIASYFNRINPQNYTHTPSQLNVYYFFTDNRTQNFAANFKGRFWMTLIDDKGGRGCPILNNLQVANALSGKWFFIRSTADPTLYWSYQQNADNHNGLTVSHTGRSRFRVSAEDSTLLGKVLIGTDLVVFEIEHTNESVSIDNSSDLYPGSDPHQFLFGDLKKNITFNQRNALLQYIGDGSSGWTWELVE